MTRPRPLVIHYAAILLAVSVVLSAAQEPSRRASPDARSLIAAGLYDDAEITARAALSEMRSARADDAEEVAAAADALVSALIFNGRAASAQTLQLAERTLQAGEILLGAVHAALLPSLLNLGEVLIAAIEFDRAVVVARRALSISERAGFVGLDQARVLGHLGRALGAAGRYDEALSCLRAKRAPDRRGRCSGGTRVGAGPRGHRAGAAAQGQLRRCRCRDSPRGADSTGVRSVASRVRADSESRRPAILVRGRPPPIERGFATSSGRCRTDPAPDHPTLALSLRYLAGTLSDLGDLIGGLTLARRALAIAERNFGLDHHVTGDIFTASVSRSSTRGSTPRPVCTSSGLKNL